MDILIKALQVILALSILVFAHEAGHYCFARLFKIKVEKFYLFFDWGFALFRWKPRNSDTEYGIGWLPIGGYCKIAGMIDESMDKESLAKEPQPWEFRSKPAWQRMLVLAGGVIFNFILAVIIYISILLGWGDSYIKNSDASIYTTDIAYEMGFRNGDRIIGFDDYTPDDFASLSADLLHEQASTATVIRDGDTVVIELGDDYISKIIQNKAPVFGLAIPFVIESVPEGSINETVFSVGDSLISIDGTPMTYLQDVRKYLASAESDSVSVEVVRNNEVVRLSARLDTNKMIQVATRMPHITTREYNIISAIPAGFEMTLSTVSSYLKELRLIASPETEAYKEVGSFIAIGNVFPSSWNWLHFWSVCALLSIMLGVVNLIPIPALDGGHILFTLYEMISGHKPSDKFLEKAQVFGMLILLALMVLAFSNDIRNFIL